MKTPPIALEINVEESMKTSSILVAQSFINLGKYLPDRPLVIISDENVDGHYSGSFPVGLKIVVKTGESSKSLEKISESRLLHSPISQPMQVEEKHSSKIFLLDSSFISIL